MEVALSSKKYVSYHNTTQRHYQNTATWTKTVFILESHSVTYQFPIEALD
jgi:hypothetical protein